MASAKIAIVDHLHGGHHAMYIRKIVDAVNKQGAEAVLFLGNVEKYKKEFAGLDYTIVELPQVAPSTHKLLFFLRDTIDRIKLWRVVINKVGQYEKENNVKFSGIFFAWLDDYLLPVHRILKSLFIRSEWNWIGISMVYKGYPIGLFGKRNRITNNDTVFIADPQCKKILTLDEGLLDIVPADLKHKIIISPDYTLLTQQEQISPLFEQAIADAKGKKIIALLGSIDQRKGLIKFLQVAKLMENEPDYRFIVIGRYVPNLTWPEHEKLFDLLVDLPKNVFIKSTYINDSEFNYLVENSSLIYAVYDNFPYSSNLLTKAAAFKKPVIVKDGLLMAKRVRENKLGTVVNTEDPVELTSAVMQAVEYPLDNQSLEKYTQFHSEAVFEQKLAESLQTLIA